MVLFSGMRPGRASRVALFLAVLVLPCFARASLASAQEWVQDPRYGFKLQPPRGWRPIPLKSDENWLVAKFLCDQKDRWTDDREGWTWEHQPELMVIAFVHEAIELARKQREEALEKLRKAKKDEKKDGSDGKDGGDEDGEDEEISIALSDPYKNYEDYLDRTYKGGGFFVSGREEGECHGIPVTRVEVKVEKLTTTGPKRIVTWIYHLEGVDVAAQFEVLENALPKHRSEFQSALGSFRAIVRTMGPLPADLRTDDGLFISLGAMKKGTPEERKQMRLRSEAQLHARALKNLPSGWQAKDNKRFLVLFDTDAGFADKINDSAEGLIEWAEENLGFIGPDEYVRRPILRLCASEEEMDSLRRGVRNSQSWGFDSGNEILGCKDDYGSGWQIDALNRELFDLWLRERDEQIWFGMPEWIQHGLYEYVEGARVSGRKLQFRNYQNEFRSFREVLRSKQNIPVRELMQMTSAEFYNVSGSYEGFFNRISQADMVVRFLLSPEAGRARLTKTLLFDYLKSLRDVVVELEGQDFATAPEKEPTTEEEEEDLYKKRHEAWESSEREREVVKRVFQRTVGGWSQKDWDSFEKAFLKFAN